MTFDRWWPTYEKKFHRKYGFEDGDQEKHARAAWDAAVRAERERCAKLCEEVVTHPAGHGGHWEGYGPVKAPRDGRACAAAIRALPDE